MVFLNIYLTLRQSSPPLNQPLKIQYVDFHQPLCEFSNTFSDFCPGITLVFFILKKNQG